MRSCIVESFESGRKKRFLKYGMDDRRIRS
jgi:hypothetical protein